MLHTIKNFVGGKNLNKKKTIKNKMKQFRKSGKLIFWCIFSAYLGQLFKGNPTSI